MDNSPAAKENLIRILKSQDYHELEQYSDQDQWKSMSSEEKRLLAKLFLEQGKHLFESGDNQAFDSFRMATKACPDDPELFYEIAETLAFDATHTYCLQMASEMLGIATELNPKDSDYWGLWGQVMTSIGFRSESLDLLAAAQDKFKIALKQISDEQEEDRAYHLWHWALCCYYQGKISGEAMDYNESINKFREAEELGIDEADFWNDFGNATINLSLLIRRFELFSDAKEYFEKAVVSKPSHHQAWTSLGICYQQEFENHCEDSFFELACAAYERATTLNEEEVTPWIKWGQILSTAAKMHHDADKLHLSSEKFAKANEMDPDHPIILGSWGEVQMLYGAYTDQLRFLHEAESKFTQALEVDPNSHFLWFLHGMCLNELGRYFSEDSYYLKAIEKLQHGIKLNRSDPHLWYALAIAFFALGEKQNDVGMLEQANKFYAHVLEFGGELYPQFWNDWGVALMKLGMITHSRQYYESAVDKFEQSILQDRFPVRTEWLYNYGCCMDYLGDFFEDPGYYEKAIEVLNKVLQLDPEFSHARYNLGLAFSHLGELTANVDAFQRALENFEILVHYDNEDDSAWNDWGLTILHLAELVKDPSMPEQAFALYEEAEGRFNQAIALGNTSTFYNLACLYSLRGKYDVAMHYIERADAAGTLPSFDDLQHDEWIDGLKTTAAFQEYLSHKYLDKSE